MKKFDFGGYATKNDLRCSDGRVIRKDAFKDNDGKTVPLVWQHLHNDPGNVLGHAVLENRADGVYAYCVLNNTTAGQNAKMLVQNGDITTLSIYANELVEKTKNVLHGVIREVSLVLSGANPGALIDNVSIAHADGSEIESDDEAVIYTGETISVEKKEETVKHEDTEDKKTVGDVFNTFTEEQKTVVYAIVAEALASDEEDDEATHSNIEGEENVMKKNVFDSKDDNGKPQATLTHSQISEIFADAQKFGSLKESFMAHAVEYGIENIDYLFPEAKTLTNAPDFVKRDTEWVSGFMGSTRHSPFSRIKSMSADITLDTARAKGYVKGALKKEEFFALAKRSTTPTTVYKKQKLDRDDIVDIVDLDVVAWMKAEMRVMLDEEVARAGLVGDGREPEDADKINETNIRPIYKDDDFYSHKVQIEDPAADAEDVIEAIIRARKYYKGSGNPVMYVNTDILTDMLLLKAAVDGRRMYATQAELEAALRVSKIVEVPVMDGLTRETGEAPNTVTWDLLAIIVNPRDYTFGADKGGGVSMFDDFDIDYNQYKYLLETRLSGCLTMPKSALVVERAQEPAGG